MELRCIERFGSPLNANCPVSARIPPSLGIGSPRRISVEAWNTVISDIRCGLTPASAPWPGCRHGDGKVPVASHDGRVFHSHFRQGYVETLFHSLADSSPLITISQPRHHLTLFRRHKAQALEEN